LLQVIDITTWNKNIHVGDGTLCGTKDIGKAEADLVSVPRPHGQRGDGHPVDVLNEPEDEGGVEQANERCDAQDGGLLSRLGIGEAEQLLAFPEEDLDCLDANHQNGPTGERHARS